MVRAEYPKLAASALRASGADADRTAAAGGASASGRMAMSGSAAAAEKLAKLSQRLALAEARVTQAEAAYQPARASSVLSTWKYTAVELPAVCLTLRALEAGRREVLDTCLCRTLNAIRDLSAANFEMAEERTEGSRRQKQSRHEVVL